MQRRRVVYTRPARRWTPDIRTFSFQHQPCPCLHLQLFLYLPVCPLPITCSVFWELGIDRYGRRPGQTQGETRALHSVSRDRTRRHGLLSMMGHAGWAMRVATRKVIDGVLRKRSLVKRSAGPTAPTSGPLHTLIIVSETDLSQQANIYMTHSNIARI